MELRKVVLALVIFFIIPFASAETKRIDITFDINSDGSVIQSSTFYFDQPINGSVNYTLDSQAKNIQVSDGSGPLSYDVADTQNGHVIDILLKEPTSILILNYTVSDIIFHAGSVEHFFTEFSFDNQVNIMARAELPEGYAIYQNSYRPDTSKIISDGRRIILQWDVVSDDVLFSVKYAKTGEEDSLWIAGVAVLAGTLIFFYLYSKQKRKDDFLFGFRHDEKLVIQHLQVKKMALQRDIEEEFNFSRSKATRIVSKLVEKGIVKKQRYGRTNKLTWTK